MFRTAILISVLLWATTANSETIELGFRWGMGTYTVPVKIGGLKERSLTFDTGASLTVLRIEDVEKLGLKPQGRAGVTFPHQGVRVAAYYYTLPKMRIGNCMIENTRVIGINLPKGRPGVLGMADLEKLSPFTFEAGRLEITCPK